MLFFLIINIVIAKFNSETVKEKGERVIKYLEFNFQRNLTLNESMGPEIVFNNLFYNQIYINIEVGSTKKIIPFYIYLQQYSFVIQSSNVNQDQVKGLYNESTSQTYEKLEEQFHFVGNDMSKGILSKETFHISNNINFPSFEFYLCKENNYKTHITEGGKIGLKLFRYITESEDTCLINNLKKNNIISYKVFLIKYNSNMMEEDKGKFIVGAYPHMYNGTYYKQEYYINDNGENFNNDRVEWIFNFDEIKIGENIIDKNTKIFFYPEIGFIIGNNNYFQYIKNLESWKWYFENDTRCYQKEFTIDDLEVKEFQQKLIGDYIGYYCYKDFETEKLNISDIKLVKKGMNFSFNINIKDMWVKNGNYNYFMIVQRKRYYNTFWLLGKPFFKQYNMIFDYDNKQIGLYTKISADIDNNSFNNTFAIYIIIIVFLLVVIIGQIFALIKCYINLPRKKRLNELLDDNYEYEKSTNINDS